MFEPRKIITRDEASALGSKRFFTGHPCKNGHVSERYTGSLQCVACLRDRAKANPQWNRTWQQNNKDKCASYSAAYRKRNPDSGKLYMRAVRKLHRSELQAVERARWAGKNKETRRAINKKKYDALQERRPGLIATYARNRRATKKNAEGHHTTADVQRIGASQRWRCAWCRQPCKGSYHVDHLIALACGGSNAPSNIVIACPTCNLKKNKKDPLSFAQELGMLL
jgi:5-methylcytosine-specific restriction endonuclease McrA